MAHLGVGLRRCATLRGVTLWDQLAPPPAEGWRRNLWLENVGGFIVMKDIRERVRGDLTSTLSPEARQAAEAAIDATIYAFLMVADGVIGRIKNDEHSVSVRIGVELADTSGVEVIQHLDLFEGDGACMGVHAWLAGDFGEVPITKPSSG